MTPKEVFESPSVIAMLGLQALANYTASGLVHPGEKMHRDIAIRLAKAIDRDKWS